jgi:hypothetical protein
MNERLKQLLGQAYDEAVPETWTTLSSEQLDRIYEKFAELIVRECVRRIEGCSIDPTQYEFDRDRAFIEGYNKAISKSASQVLLHFGVEE